MKKEVHIVSCFSENYVVKLQLCASCAKVKKKRTKNIEKIRDKKNKVIADVLVPFSRCTVTSFVSNLHPWHGLA